MASHSPSVPASRARSLVCALAALVAIPASAASWSKGYTATPKTPLTGPEVIIASPRVDGNTIVVTQFRNGQPCIWKFDGDGSNPRVACVAHGIAGQSILLGDGGQLLFGGAPGEKDRSGYVIRIHADSRVGWAKRLTTPDEKITLGTAAPSDDSFLVGGNAGNRALIVKLSPDGTVKWRRTYDGSYDDSISKILPLQYGSFIAAGELYSRPWLAQMTSSGEIEWQVNFGRRGHITDATATPDGYVLSGITFETSSWQLWIAAVSRDGKVRWERTAETPDLEGLRTFALPSGNVLLAGSTGPTQGRLRLLTLDKNGSIVSHRVIQGATGVHGVNVALASEGEHVIVTFDDDGTLYLQKIPLDPAAAIACGTSSFGTINFRSDTRVRTFPADVAVGAIADASFPATIETAAFKPANDCPDWKPAAKMSNPSSQGSTFELQWNAIEAERSALRDRVRTLLKNRSFDELETIAAGYRQSRETFASGYVKLTGFYDAFSDNETVAPEEQIALIREWQRKKPKSITAAVAMALARVHIAWVMRGGGFSGTVSESGWRELATHLEAAQATLDANKAATGETAYWRARLQTAGIRCEGLDAVVREVIRRAPRDRTVYTTGLTYVLPRWCGDHAAAHAFADAAARATASDWGDAMYSYLASALLEFEGETSFRAYGFDWPRMQRGYRDLIRIWPKLFTSHHQFARMARVMGDRSIAAQLFARPELTWFPGVQRVWSEYDHVQAQKWAAPPPAASAAPMPQHVIALAPAPATWAREPVSAWPRIILENKIELRDGKTYDGFQSFIVAAPNAVVAVSALTPLDDMTPEMRTAIPLARLKETMKSWQMSAPGWVLSANVMDMPDRDKRNYNRYAVGQLTGNRFPVSVLMIAPAAPSMGDILVVLGCAPDKTPCVQVGYPVRVKEIGGPADAPISIAVEIKDDVDRLRLAGSPVINAEGHAVAVVTTPSGESRLNTVPVRRVLQEARILEP
jgi:hypothetical protein